MEPDYEAADEKCLVRLQNFKEPIVDATTENAAEQTKTLSKDNHQSKMSQKDEAEVGSKLDKQSETSSQRMRDQIENFQLEALSQKVICLRTTNAEAFDGTLMVQHSEAMF